MIRLTLVGGKDLSTISINPFTDYHIVESVDQKTYIITSLGRYEIQENATEVEKRYKEAVTGLVLSLKPVVEIRTSGEVKNVRNRIKNSTEEKENVNE